MYDPLNWPAQPGNPSAIRVASVIGFSVLYSLFLCSLFSATFFLILLQYNIRLPDPNYNVCDLEFLARVNLRRHNTSPDPNCDVCAPKFAPRVNLRRDDTSTRTAMYVMTIFC